MRFLKSLLGIYLDYISDNNWISISMKAFIYRREIKNDNIRRQIYNEKVFYYEETEISSMKRKQEKKSEM